MFKPCLFLVSTLITGSVFSAVSFEEKKNRIEYLEELTSSAVSMNIDAYRRELQYEKKNLPVEKRAKIEANLLAEKIKVQIQRAYDAALTSGNHQEAAQEVRTAIEKDLALISPELRKEIREISLETLGNIQQGEISQHLDLENVEKIMLKNVLERADFFNKEGEEIHQTAMLTDGDPAGNADRSEYDSKTAILESLVSDLPGATFGFKSNTGIKSDSITSLDSKISLQVKVNFLGISLEAGPTISFSRTYNTSAVLIAEGLGPFLLPDGHFDFLKRDRTGNSIVQNGIHQKRPILFSCRAALGFESAYSGQGGFSVMGMGGSVSVSQRYSNSVHLDSRRLAVPEYIDGKSVTLNMLNRLCHSDFLKSRITNTMNVTDSLNVMMKNVIQGLSFSHPKTKCMTDNHCLNWFNTKVIALARYNNQPRCVEEKREKYHACELRGLEGQNCTVLNSQGKLVSDGVFEFTCDAGLTCVKVQEEGWFKGWDLYRFARGKCLPGNRKSN